MMRRTRPRHRRRHSGRVRAVLSLGLLLGITQVGTLASWTDSATVAGGDIASGTLDLTVGESSANQLSGPGGTWTHTTLALAAMAPGESLARALSVGNGGSVALAYNAAVVTSNNDLLNGLQLTVVEGATVGNTGTQAANNRSGTCTGGTATALTSANVSTTASSLHAAPASLASAGVRTYCVRVLLVGTAPNAMQGKTTALTFSFNASQ